MMTKKKTTLGIVAISVFAFTAIITCIFLTFLKQPTPPSKVVTDSLQKSNYPTVASTGFKDPNHTLTAKVDPGVSQLPTTNTLIKNNSPIIVRYTNANSQDVYMQLIVLDKDNISTTLLTDRLKMNAVGNSTFTVTPTFNKVLNYKGRPGFLQFYITTPPISEGAAKNGGKSFKQIATVYVRF